MVRLAVIVVLSILAIQQTFAAIPGPREVTNFAWYNLKQSVDKVDKFVNDRLSYSNPSVKDGPAPDNWESLKIKAEHNWHRFTNLLGQLLQSEKNKA